MPLTHNLTEEQINNVQNLVNNGDYNGAWKELERLGDSYADNAADVIEPPSSPGGEFFNELVRQHWNNTAGEGVYESKFDEVAKTHLNNYLDILSDTDNWPNTEDIERSYRDAVTRQDLPPETAFDGVFSASFMGSVFGAEWEDFLNIEEERIVPSDVFDDLEFLDSSSILAQDFIDTLSKFLEEGNYAPLANIIPEVINDELEQWGNELLPKLLDLSGSLQESIDELFSWLPTPP